MNADAAFQPVPAMGKGGVVLRDAGGRILAATAKSYSHVPEYLMP